MAALNDAPIPDLPMNTVEVNQWLDTAVRWAGDYRDNPDGHVTWSLTYALVRRAAGRTEPLALDRLQAFVAAVQATPRRGSARRSCSSGSRR